MNGARAHLEALRQVNDAERLAITGKGGEYEEAAKEGLAELVLASISEPVQQDAKFRACVLANAREDIARPTEKPCGGADLHDLRLGESQRHMVRAGRALR